MAPEKVSCTECVRLREFKDFLLSIAKTTSSGDATVASRVCISRSNNETYPVCTQEVRAEIIMTLWNNLQQKRCPRYFQMSIIRIVAAEVENCFRNAKDCEFSTCGKKPEQQERETASNNTTKTTTETKYENTLYDLGKLQKYVVNYLERFLSRLNDNTEAVNLQNYAETGALCSLGVICKCSAIEDTVTETGRSTTAHQQLELTTRIHYTVGHIKNKPRKMEDRHVCIDRFSDLYELNQASLPSYSFFGVFDGHSGPLAASYASSQIPYALANNLKAMPCNVLMKDDAKFYREAFEYAFLQTDKMFCAKTITSGTTAVCVLLSHHNSSTNHHRCHPHGSHLYVAWVGDSKALLVSPTVHLQLVKSHKPDSVEERKRIETSAPATVEVSTGIGTVMFVQGQWRVNGVLNVSRSIGDYTVGPAIAEPDFVDVPLTAAHDFIILGTDGLFDHVVEGVLVETIYKALVDTEKKIENIPKMLIELAKGGDSQDNITVVIVFLKSRADIVQNFTNI